MDCYIRNEALERKKEKITAEFEEIYSKVANSPVNSRIRKVYQIELDRISRKSRDFVNKHDLYFKMKRRHCLMEIKKEDLAQIFGF